MVKVKFFSLCLTLLAATTAFSGPDFSKVQIKTIKVSSHVHMLQGFGGNIAVSAGEDGILMVDDQFRELSGKIKSAIAKISQKKIKFLINTHWHFDHTGGNVDFGDEALIVAHENVRQRLSKDQYIALFDKKVPKTPKEGLPVVTFPDSLKIHFNNDEISLIHLPNGHTDGDSAIYFKKANVVHLGDHFFVGKFPFVDLGAGGSVSGYVKNLDAMIKRLPKDVKIIPGHGPLATMKDLLVFKSMIEKTQKYIADKMAKNVSLADIRKEGLPLEWKGYGDGFIKENVWIGIVYESLKLDAKKTKSS